MGDCDLQIQANSDPDLYKQIAAEAVAEDSPFRGTAPPVSGHHILFVAAGIPAVDLIDFTYGPGPSLARWHTTEDIARQASSREPRCGQEAAARPP